MSEILIGLLSSVLTQGARTIAPLLLPHATALRSLVALLALAQTVLVALVNGQPETLDMNLVLHTLGDAGQSFLIATGLYQLLKGQLNKLLKRQ